MVKEEGQGEGVGREEADGGMRAEGVVFVFPVVDEEACFCDGMEPVLVEAIVAEGAVEAFDEGVLHGFAGLDVVEVDVIALSPEMQRFAGELGAVVGSDGVGKAVGLGERIEHGSHRRTADGGIHVQGQALTGEVVHERQAAKAASAGKLVVNEIHAPALVGHGGLWQEGTRAIAGSFRRCLLRRESPSSR